MGSAFERVVRRVVQELDHSGELIPMTSLQNSTGFQPYFLVVRKPSSSWFWKPRYKCVNLSIKDILEPDAPEPDLQRGSTFHFYDAVDGQLRGGVELSAPGQAKIAGGASVSDSSSTSMHVYSLSVDPNTWQTLLHERHLRQPEHKILQELRSRGDNVYVVTEVLQTQEEVEVTRTHRREGSGQFSLPGAMCLQGEGQGHLAQKKTVTIPSGSILAFRVAQLVINSDLDILLFPDKKQRTFQPPPTGHKPSRSVGAWPQLPSGLSMMGCLPNFLADGVPAEGTFTEDFQGLRAEVEAISKELELLDRELCQLLLEGLEGVLRDQLALRALEEALEQGPSLGPVEPLDGPAGAVLECLVLESRMLVPELAVPIVYLLGALTRTPSYLTLPVLSETQHELLAEALESQTLFGPLELVGSLLEQSAPWQERSTMSLPPGLLGSSWGEGAPAWVLLEECGLELGEDTPYVCWEPQAQGHMCALYASLALLSELSQEPH
ncbi:gasdermin-D isoform X1 [Trachypithecus francoisi]|uniref:gasdermin-D isoform X1 n=1 Tax=Trachypithecus francoisi TaxID=54180 RepID=UPI00141B5175|nr:gasdermin-D isoform X1 [Trachypithecus francoisi]